MKPSDPSRHRTGKLDARQRRFELLVLPHLDRLHEFARRRIAEADEAEDLVQVACLRAWSGFHELRHEDRVRAWLYRILRGVLSEHLEKHGRRRQLVEINRLEAVHEQLIANGQAGPLDEVLARACSDRIRAALDRMPEDFAAAVELHDLDGFRYREIAEITGVPMGTVMSRIHRGRKLLAALLADDACDAGGAAAHESHGEAVDANLRGTE